MPYNLNNQPIRISHMTNKSIFGQTNPSVNVTYSYWETSGTETKCRFWSICFKMDCLISHAVHVLQPLLITFCQIDWYSVFSSQSWTFIENALKLFLMISPECFLGLCLKCLPLEGRALCSVMAKMLDYCLKASEFKLHSHCYVHF